MNFGEEGGLPITSAKPPERGLDPIISRSQGEKKIEIEEFLDSGVKKKRGGSFY